MTFCEKISENGKTNNESKCIITFKRQQNQDTALVIYSVTSLCKTVISPSTSSARRRAAAAKIRSSGSLSKHPLSKRSNCHFNFTSSQAERRRTREKKGNEKERESDPYTFIYLVVPVRTKSSQM